MMKLKSLWVIALSAVTAMAFSQSLTVRGTSGFGFAGAPDTDRPNAKFQFSVTEFEYNGQTRLFGSFSVEVRGPDGVTVIYLPRAGELAVDAENKVAEFSGNAWAVHYSRRGIRRTQGFVSVRVVDNREPRNTQGDPDTLEVAFYTDPDADPVFSYAGVVLRGDILVYERTYSR